MLSELLNLLLNVLFDITNLRCLPPTEIQIADLLPHLGQKRDPSGQRSLSRLPVLPCPPSVSKVADPPPAKGRGAPLAPLPDSIQRLAERRSKQHYHQTSPSRGSRGSQTSDLKQRAGAFSKAPAEFVFLSYIAAGRRGLQRSESPSSIRALFQQGALSSQILGLRACSPGRKPSLWLALKEPRANSKAQQDVHT